MTLFRTFYKNIKKTEKTTKAVSADLAKLVDTMLTTQQSPEDIKKLLEIERPINTKYLVTPTINKEIFDVLPTHVQQKDIIVQKLQSNITKGMIPLI